MKHYLLILISVISVSCNNYYQELSFNYENASKDKMNDIIKIILEKDYKDQIYQKKYSYYTEKSKFNFKTNDIIPYWCYINNKNYDHVTFKHLQVVRTSVTLDLVEIFKNHCDIKENLKKLILNNNITLDENLIYLMTIKNKEYWTDFLIKNYKKNISEIVFNNRYKQHNTLQEDNTWIYYFFSKDFDDLKTIVKVQKINKFLFNKIKDSISYYSPYLDSKEKRSQIIKFYSDKRFNFSKEDFDVAYSYLKNAEEYNYFVKHTNTYDSLLSNLLRYNRYLDNYAKKIIIDKIPNNKLYIKTKNNNSFYHLAGKIGDYKLIRRLKKNGIRDDYNNDSFKGFDIAIENKYYSVAKEIDQSKYLTLARYIINN